MLENYFNFQWCLVFGMVKSQTITETQICAWNTKPCQQTRNCGRKNDKQLGLQQLHFINTAIINIYIYHIYKYVYKNISTLFLLKTLAWNLGILRWIPPFFAIRIPMNRSFQIVNPSAQVTLRTWKWVKRRMATEELICSLPGLWRKTVWWKMAT